ncbi:MAG: GAF domain-containing sensor histidine kinase [Chloroflexota bacterium]|nr:GAF domain-containing sensor histidine kinase [Chloroflexota bacterium]
MLINHASADPRFRNHPGLALYGIESYIAVPLTRRDGSYFGTLCALDPQPTDLGEDAFEIFRLLAQLIAFEMEADEERRRREADLRALEDFIAIAAHDLRQPLTILSGRLQLLVRQVRRSLPAGEVAARLDDLMVQARRAVALSNTLLDVAQMEAGGFTIDRAPLDLMVLARQTVDEVRVVAPQHTFLLEGPDTLPYTGDERRLGQVLRNLLDNAAKYAPAESGPVVLTIEDAPMGDGRKWALVTIRDAGLGVPDEELAKIFDRRYRSPRAVEEGISGTGLGLYIVRRIVEAHGGTIRAEHAPGGGLLVRLGLPHTE